MTNHTDNRQPTIRQSVEERLAQAAFRAKVRDMRSHTARIREAVKDLPLLISHEGFDLESDQQHLREALQEIIGSATHIADALEVEL